jgi:hypothetical protein
MVKNCTLRAPAQRTSAGRIRGVAGWIGSEEGTLLLLPDLRSFDVGIKVTGTHSLGSCELLHARAGVHVTNAISI